MVGSVRILGLVGAFVVVWAAVAPASASAGNMFGLVSAAAPDAPPARSEFATMNNRAGVISYRAFFPWAEIEPADDLFDWQPFDEAVGRAASEGIQTVPFVWGSPRWVTGCVGERKECTRRPPLGSRSQKAEWRQLLRELVARYGPGGEYWTTHPGTPQKAIRAWQIWNEPNLVGFYGPKPSPRGYANLLRLSAKTIKRRDPRAKIILGGLGPGTARRNVLMADFLNRLYRVRRAKRSFDAVAVHPYAENIKALRRQISLARRSMSRNRDSRTPLWVTEIGWSSNPKPGKLAKGRSGQAKLVRRSLGVFSNQRRRWRLRRVFYYAWRDRRPPESLSCWCANAGLREADLDPKPAWVAFERFLAEFADDGGGGGGGGGGGILPLPLRD